MDKKKLGVAVLVEVIGSSISVSCLLQWSKSRCLKKSKRNRLAYMTFALGRIRLQVLVAQRFPGKMVVSLPLLSFSSRNLPMSSLYPCKFLASTISHGCVNTRVC